MKHTVSYLNCIDHAADRADLREGAFLQVVSDIESDDERVMDAAVSEDEDDKDLRLAELRIVLRNACGALDKLFHGDTLDEATDLPANLDAMRALICAAEESDVFITQRICDAAADQVGE